MRGPALLAIAALLAGCGSGGILAARGEPVEAPRIVIGSKDFTESIIVAKLYGGALAAHGYVVEYRHTLPAAEILAAAGEVPGIDLYPEYTGAAFAAFLGEAPPADPERVYATVTQHYATQDQALLAMTPASHSEALVVTRETAASLGVQTISDLASRSAQLILGAPGDCAERPTCAPGLESTYGVRFAALEPIDAEGLRYQALVDGQIHVAFVVETDPQIAQFKLVVLDDDRHLFPAYNVVPVVRDAYLDAAPEGFQTLVDRVSARITSRDLSALNALVEIELQDPTRVVEEWLADEGLIDR